MGSDSRETLDTLRTLYEPIIEQSFPIELDPRPKVAVPFVTTDLVSAEMIRYASNAFLATKISFINEISNLCELVGADIGEVAYSIALDGRIGSRILRRPYAISSKGAGHNTLVLRWTIGRTALRSINGHL